MTTTPARPAAETIRQRLLAIMDQHPGQYLSAGQFAEFGAWSAKERKNLAINLSTLPEQVVERAKIANPGKGRAECIGYRRVTAAAETALAPSLIARRAMSGDPASQALARPPRGRSVEVPSLAHAPMPGSAIVVKRLDDDRPAHVPNPEATPSADSALQIALSIDNAGKLSIRYRDQAIELDPAHTRELGEFMLATEPAWS